MNPPKVRAGHVPGAAVLPGDPSCCNSRLFSIAQQSLQDVFLGVPLSLAWLCRADVLLHL